MSKKTINFILIISFIILLLIGLIIYGEIFWFFEVLKSTQGFIANKLDINKNLVLAASFPIAILYFKYGILNLFSTKSKKQWTGLYIHSTFMMIFYIAMFLFPKNSMLNPLTGESIQCFTRYKGKLYKVDCDWTVHENYGTQVFEPTTKIIKEWREQEGLDNNNPYENLEKSKSKFKSLK